MPCTRQFASTTPCAGPVRHARGGDVMVIPFDHVGVVCPVELELHSADPVGSDPRGHAIGHPAPSVRSSISVSRQSSLHPPQPEHIRLPAERGLDYQGSGWARTRIERRSGRPALGLRRDAWPYISASPPMSERTIPTCWSSAVRDISPAGSPDDFCAGHCRRGSPVPCAGSEPRPGSARARALPQKSAPCGRVPSQFSPEGCRS